MIYNADNLNQNNQNNPAAKGVVLPNNGIWFRPKNAGIFRFVLYTGTGTASFALAKVTRSGGTTENPFYGRTFSASLALNWQKTNNLPAYLLFYYDYNVTQTEIDAGTEFVIMCGDNPGAYFMYLDIGISGGQGEGGEKEEKKSLWDTLKDLLKKAGLLAGLAGLAGLLMKNWPKIKEFLENIIPTLKHVGASIVNTVKDGVIE